MLAGTNLTKNTANSYLTNHVNGGLPAKLRVEASWVDFKRLQRCDAPNILHGKGPNPLLFGVICDDDGGPVRHCVGH